MACKYKIGDNVKVIAGKEKGKEGKIIKIDHKNNRVLIEGLNKIHKHQKPSAKVPSGGIIEVEAPIDMSNILYNENGTATRVGFKLEDGKKVRFAKKSGNVID